MRFLISLSWLGMLYANSMAGGNCQLRNARLTTENILDGSYESHLILQFTSPCRGVSVSQEGDGKLFKVKIKNASLSGAPLRDSTASLKSLSEISVTEKDAGSELAMIFRSPILGSAGILYGQGDSVDGIDIEIRWANESQKKAWDPRRSAVPVTFFSLFGDEQAYHNKRIGIMGFFYRSFEESYLCFDKSSNSKGLRTNCIWVSTRIGKPERHNGKKVYIEGIYSMLNNGRDFIQGALVEADSINVVD